MSCSLGKFPTTISLTLPAGSLLGYPSLRLPPRFLCFTAYPIVEVPPYCGIGVYCFLVFFSSEFPEKEGPAQPVFSLQVRVLVVGVLVYLHPVMPPGVRIIRMFTGPPFCCKFGERCAGDFSGFEK